MDIFFKGERIRHRHGLQYISRAGIIPMQGISPGIQQYTSVELQESNYSLVTHFLTYNNLELLGKINLSLEYISSSLLWETTLWNRRFTSAAYEKFSGQFRGNLSFNVILKMFYLLEVFLPSFLHWSDWELGKTGQWLCSYICNYIIY